MIMKLVKLKPILLATTLLGAALVLGGIILFQHPIDQTSSMAVVSNDDPTAVSLAEASTPATSQPHQSTDDQTEQMSIVLSQVLSTAAPELPPPSVSTNELAAVTATDLAVADPQTVQVLGVQTVSPEPVPNVVVLRVESNQMAQLQADVAAQGGTVEIVNEVLGAVTIYLPDAEAAKQVASSPYVQASEPDYYAAAQSLPTDDRLSDQWALTEMQVPLDQSTNLPIIKIGVIDSGICDLPELAEKVLPGFDFVENDAIPQDAMGHGCAVSSIIAASADGVGMVGVAHNVQLLPYRVLDAQGNGRYSHVASAIVRAVQDGAQIINLSIGGANPSQLMQDAVDYAVAHNVLLISAAGNQGSSRVLYPAAYSNVVSVGAIDQTGAPAAFSNMGKVDVWGPGVSILALTLGNSYAFKDGSSFAAANVTGLAALELAQGRTLTLGGSSAVYGGETQVVVVPTATEVGQSESGFVVHEDHDFGWSVKYPANWVNSLLFENSTSEASVIKRSVGFVGQSNEHIIVDVWVDEANSGLEAWFNTHHKPLMGNDETQYTVNGKIAGVDAILVSDLNLNPGEISSQVAIFRSGKFVYRIEYFITHQGESESEFRQFLSGFSLENTDVISDLSALPALTESVKSEITAQVDACGTQYSGGNPFPCCANGGNCTWWAWAKRPDFGWDMLRNARYWWEDAISKGYPTGQTPRAGAIAVWGGNNAYGHVAYVESTNADGSFYISEMNCGGEEGLPWYTPGPLYKTVNKGYTGEFLGFVYKKGEGGDIPGTPTITSPSNGAILTSPVTIAVQQGALNYTNARDFHLHIASDSAFTSMVYTQNSNPNPSFTVSLNPGRYYARVVQGDTVSSNSNPSGVVSFIVGTTARFWDFSGGLQGWVPLNAMTNQQQLASGIQFNNGFDPHIGSPYLANFNASQYTHAYIEMTNSRPAGGTATGQIFIQNSTMSGFAEPHVGFTVTMDGTLGRYLVPLSGNPYWTGTITRLRFDPNNTDSSTSRIDKFYLVNVAPTNINLVQNPAFIGGSYASWKKSEGQGQAYVMTTSDGKNVVAFTSPTTSNSAVPHQDIAYGFNVNTPVEINALIGNTSNVSKTLILTLVSSAVASDKFECTFTLPPNMPLSQYTIRGKTTSFWPSMRLHFWNKSWDGLPAIIMTDASVQHKLGMAVVSPTGIDCIAPTFPIPAAPVLTVPTLTNDSTPTVGWNVVPNAYRYIVEFSQNNFATIAHTSGNIATTSYAPGNTLADGIYAVRVRALNALGKVGPNSAVKSLTIDSTPPQVPMITAPVSNSIVTTLTPKITWGVVTGAVGYELRYGSTNPPGLTASVTTTSHTLSTPLIYGLAYIQVRAKDAANNWSAWSSMSSFTINTPASAAPRVVRQGTTATLTWLPQDWALGYEVQVSVNTTFESLSFSTNSLTAGTGSMQATLQPGTYYWRIRGKTGADTWGVWSATQPLIVR